MGFALFTQSGTFNPLTYGLSVGDLIHIKCVGGGGGGGYVKDSNTSYEYRNGANGTASSFGTILTSDGGLGGLAEGTMQANVDGSNIGTFSLRSTIQGQAYLSLGSGGNGWSPKSGNTCPTLPSALYIPYVRATSESMYPALFDSSYTGKSIIFDDREITVTFGTVNSIGIRTPNTLPYGHGGCCYGAISSSSVFALSAGGSGYGAGGGAGCWNSNGSSNAAAHMGSGGSSGVIKDIDYVLTTASPIPVTVGTGGLGGVNNTTTTENIVGGGGANGCVAVWW